MVPGTRLNDLRVGNVSTDLCCATNTKRDLRNNLCRSHSGWHIIRDREQFHRAAPPPSPQPRRVCIDRVTFLRGRACVFAFVGNIMSSIYSPGDGRKNNAHVDGGRGRERDGTDLTANTTSTCVQLEWLRSPANQRTTANVIDLPDM